MAVDLVVLDPNITNGVKVKQKVMSSVTTTDSGGEERLQRWTLPRWEYSFPYKSMARDEFVALADFHALRGGRARAFLIWDPAHFYVANQNIGTGDGSNKDFQLVRGASDSGNSLSKPIRYPVTTGTSVPVNLQLYGQTAATSVAVAGVAKTEGADYTVDTSTGLVSFVSAPANGAAIVASFWHYVPARFDSDEFELDLDSLYADAIPDLIEVLYE